MIGPLGHGGNEPTVRVARRTCHREAGYRGSLAPEGIPVVLAMEIETNRETPPASGAQERE